jgi:hypothetical protein
MHEMQSRKKMTFRDPKYLDIDILQLVSSPKSADLLFFGYHHDSTFMALLSLIPSSSYCR